MYLLSNHIIPGSAELPILLDAAYEPTGTPKPVIVFAHGFKGFKDWGHFNSVMEYFASEGFVFVKFNFSYNGGTMEQPFDFPDLEAFGNNNYSKELDDLRKVLDWVEQTDRIPDVEIDRKQLYMIGHSRGGGIAILKAAADPRVKKLVTWAAVSDFESRLPQDLSTWKNEGVIYIENARTHQQMPMYYQFVEDLQKNADKLNIEQAERCLKIPHLIMHGSEDEAVSVEDAHRLKQWNPEAILRIIAGAGHTFGAKHPHQEVEFPPHVQEVLEGTLDFLKS